jgi:hypothetical protein
VNPRRPTRRSVLPAGAAATLLPQLPTPALAAQQQAEATATEP